jgi:uncharacterized membrane protein
MVIHPISGEFRKRIPGIDAYFFMARVAQVYRPGTAEPEMAIDIMVFLVNNGYLVAHPSQ